MNATANEAPPSTEENQRVSEDQKFEQLISEMISKCEELEEEAKYYRQLASKARAMRANNEPHDKIKNLILSGLMMQLARVIARS